MKKRCLDCGRFTAQRRHRNKSGKVCCGKLVLATLPRRSVVCVNCKRTFDTTHQTVKMCSRDCRLARRRATRVRKVTGDIECSICHKTVPRVRYRQIFCSSKCRLTSYGSPGLVKKTDYTRCIVCKGRLPSGDIYFRKFCARPCRLEYYAAMQRLVGKTGIPRSKIFLSNEKLVLATLMCRRVEAVLRTGER